MSRASIKGQIVALLEATPDFSGRVYPSLVYPISEISLPAARVYYGDEVVDGEEQALEPPWLRNVELHVDIVLFANTQAGIDIDDELNRLKMVVETEFRKDHTFSGDAVGTRLVGSSAPELSGEADKPAMLMTVTHEVMYDE